MARVRRVRGGAQRYPRTHRLNQVLREVLAEELERLVESDVDLLTVTGVTVDSDLRNAVVWLASMSEEAELRLEASRVALQAAVARQTRMRRTPRLTFRVDHGVVAGSVVEEAIRRLRQSEPVPSEPVPSEPVPSEPVPEGKTGTGAETDRP